MKTYKIFLANGSVYGTTEDPIEAIVCLAKLRIRSPMSYLEIEENAHMLKGA